MGFPVLGRVGLVLIAWTGVLGALLLRTKWVVIFLGTMGWKYVPSTGEDFALVVAALCLYPFGWFATGIAAIELPKSWRCGLLLLAVVLAGVSILQLLDIASSGYCDRSCRLPRSQELSFVERLQLPASSFETRQRLECRPIRRGEQPTGEYERSDGVNPTDAHPVERKNAE